MCKLGFHLSPLLLMFVQLYSFGGARALAEQAPKEAGLCEIAAHPKHFAGQLIALRAKILNGSPHGLFLADQICPRLRIQVDYNTEGTDSSLSALDELILGKMTSEAGGIFVGTVKWLSSSHRWFFLLVKVENLEPADSPGSGGSAREVTILGPPLIRT